MNQSLRNTKEKLIREKHFVTFVRLNLKAAQLSEYTRNQNMRVFVMIAICVIIRQRKKEILRDIYKDT